MGRKARLRLRRLDAELARAHPHLDQPERLIAEGAVIVDGRIVTNPASLVPVGASIVVRTPRPLRGKAKLRVALAAFDVPASSRCSSSGWPRRRPTVTGWPTP